jgi:hypothetical protein
MKAHGDVRLAVLHLLHLNSRLQAETSSPPMKEHPVPTEWKAD